MINKNRRDRTFIGGLILAESTDQSREVRQDQNHRGGEQNHRSLSDLFVFEHDGGLLIILVVLADQLGCSRPISGLEIFYPSFRVRKAICGQVNKESLQYSPLSLVYSLLCLV